MMEKVATKILGILSDLRFTHQDIDYLAWQMIYQAPKPMQKRLLILADALIFHHAQQKENDNDYS
jgi:hypothetical protein